MKTFNFMSRVKTAINNARLPSVKEEYEEKRSRGNSTKNNGHLNKKYKPKRKKANRTSRRQRALNSR
jgi:hypothetical protein